MRHLAGGLVLAILVTLLFLVREKTPRKHDRSQPPRAAQRPAPSPPFPPPLHVTTPRPDRKSILEATKPSRLQPSSSIAPAAGGSGPTRYLLRDGNVNAHFTDRGVALSLLQPGPAENDTLRRGWGLHWTPVGTTPVEPRPRDPEPGFIHHLVGPESEWKTHLQGARALVYESVKPGVDLLFERRNHGVEYRFHLEPGVDPRSLRFRYDGALGLKVLGEGSELEIETGLGVVREHGLRCFQERPEGPRDLPSRYVKTGPTEYAVAVENADPHLPLVIDPVIDWTFLIAGNSLESAHDVAVDGAGFIYLTGATSSTTFPIVGGFDSTWDGSGDGFVTKVDPTGTFIVWSTYLGDTGNEGGQSIALDSAGHVYVTGPTTSTNFPGAASGFQTMLNGTDPDAFLSKIDASGSFLHWSTYLGGSGIEDSWGLAIDSTDSAIIVGRTWSADFPLTNAFDTVFQSQTEAFVAKIDTAGPTLTWATYLGGSSNEEAYAVDVDSLDAIYVTGDTVSADFPVPGGFDTVKDGTWDVFVTKLASDGSGVTWGTFLGGPTGPVSGFELGRSIAVDPWSNVYVTGKTNSDGFPTTGGFQTTYGGNEDAFIAKINASGAVLEWSSYLGGSDEDEGRAVAVDTAGSVYFTGFTRSPDIPILNAFDETLEGNYEVFVTKVFPNGRLAWSSYLGDTSDENVWGMDVTTPDNVYVAVRDDAGFDIILTHLLPTPPTYPEAGYCGALGVEIVALLTLVGLWKRRRKRSCR